MLHVVSARRPSGDHRGSSQTANPTFAAAPYEIMVTDGRVHDIDKDDMDRWCEYIFYRGLYRTAYARISRGSVTDTELQVGQFAVPSYGTTTGEGEMPEADRYLRSWREDLPKEHVRPFCLLPPFSSSPCVASLTRSRSQSGSLMRTTATSTPVVCAVTITTSSTRYVSVEQTIKFCEARRSADYWVVGPTFSPDSRYTTNCLQRQHPRQHQHHHQPNDLDGKAS